MPSQIKSKIGPLIGYYEQALDELSCTYDIKQYKNVKFKFRNSKNFELFLDGETYTGMWFQPVKLDESVWYKEGGLLCISLIKVIPEVIWSSLLIDDAIDLDTVELMKKELLKQRFQSEHPKFDFTNAEVHGADGQVPDAKTFMRNMQKL